MFSYAPAVLNLLICKHVFRLGILWPMRLIADEQPTGVSLPTNLSTVFVDKPRDARQGTVS